MDRKALAEETRAAVERGAYVRSDGRSVDFRALVAVARSGTRLYRPAEAAALLEKPGSGGAPPRIEVTPESTAEAGRRLVRKEGIADVAVLNFASARNPGGGWLGGARAQEEDLAMCSALVTCQENAFEYYSVNRAESSLLYTDHLIHSPRVPFIRDEDYALSPEPYLLSVITAPAPNAGEHLKRRPDDLDGVVTTLRRRAGQVLAVARDRGHRTLVLGAWGCGVFKNDPPTVAEAFRTWLADPRFAGAFDRVVFGILDRGPTQRTLSAFRNAFPETSR